MADESKPEEKKQAPKPEDAPKKKRAAEVEEDEDEDEDEEEDEEDEDGEESDEDFYTEKFLINQKAVREFIKATKWRDDMDAPAGKDNQEYVPNVSDDFLIECNEQFKKYLTQCAYRANRALKRTLLGEHA